MMQRIDDGALPYYRFAGWDGLTHGVFTRHGGVSEGAFDSLNLGGTVGDRVEAVRENHERIYAALGVRREQTVTVWQVHGVDTVIADRPVMGRRWLALADAMMTDRPGVALVMRYADCTPILAFDPVRGVIGIAHAGWRGTVAGMAWHLTRAMVEAYGCRPADLRAGVGPSIGPDRYQVGDEVVAAARAHYGEDALPALFRRDPADGTAYFNLWEANRRDLLRAGLDPDHIAVAGLCTATRTDEFYSHRAERGRTGRFGALMML
jgi:hypothetical protein